MHSIAKTSALLLILAALLSACGGAATPDRSAVDAILTEGVQTMVAGHFQTQTALVTPPTATTAVTLTPAPSYTPFGAGLTTPSSTPTWQFFTATLGTPLSPTVTGTLSTATVDPASLGVGCNNLAFITHVNVPNGTVMKPLEDFRKTWKVSNTGTCKWLSQYTLAFIGGDALNGKSIKLGREFAINHWADFSVGLGAPKNPGTYTGYWRLMNLEGTPFGATLVVSIIVKAPTDTPAPTNTPAPTDTSAPTNTPTPTPTPETEVEE
jgi:hypothetical protein